MVFTVKGRPSGPRLRDTGGFYRSVRRRVRYGGNADAPMHEIKKLKSSADVTLDVAESACYDRLSHENDHRIR